MKYEINSRYTGEVKFTAEIDCPENSSEAIKIGLAVKWALNNKVYLSGADLRRANLSGADLRRANLSGANLSDTNLSGANLSDTDLSDTDLSGANLSGANLRRADLSDTDLRRADLSGADLRRANLSGADLSGADLRRADLRRADLSDTDLRGAVGNMLQVKSLQLDKYLITYTKDILNIGCQTYTINEWKNFTDVEISEMACGALEWWKKWKDTLLKIIEMSPAEEGKI